MEIKTRTIYVAQDGNIFFTKEECECYEKNKYRMFKDTGEETNEIDDAKYIYFHSNESIQLFTEQIGSDTEGCYFEKPIYPGLWQWTYDETGGYWEYKFKLSPKIFNAIAKSIFDLGSQE